jgi:hypothetical protein
MIDSLSTGMAKVPDSVTVVLSSTARVSTSVPGGSSALIALWQIIKPLFKI